MREHSMGAMPPTPPAIGHEALCRMCEYQGRTWPTAEQAEGDATWHVYEQHPTIWARLFGSRPPRERDPR